MDTRAEMLILVDVLRGLASVASGRSPMDALRHGEPRFDVATQCWFFPVESVRGALKKMSDSRLEDLVPVSHLHEEQPEETIMAAIDLIFSQSESRGVLRVTAHALRDGAI